MKKKLVLDLAELGDAFLREMKIFEIQSAVNSSSGRANTDGGRAGVGGCDCVCCRAIVS